MATTTPIRQIESRCTGDDPCDIHDPCPAHTELAAQVLRETTRTVTIPYDGSGRLAGIDGWRNPCGHIDYYDVVRSEARSPEPVGSGK